MGVADLVRTLGAVQAQDYPGAKWGVGQRLRGVTDADVEDAFTRGDILRTHVLRPTWHFVAPEDIRWMLALTADRISAVMATYNKVLGLTPAILRRGNDVIARALEGGKQRTRAELKSALVKAGIDAEGTQRLSRLVMQAELDRVICSGARHGSQFTYALLDERAPAWSPRDRDESLLDLTRRYFATRGPATVHDFSWWSGLSVGESKRGIEIAGNALERVTLHDKSAWLSADAPRLPAAKRTAHLLPNYDEYFIGYRDRSAAGVRARKVNLITGGSALINHVVFVDGQVVGGWKRLQEGASTVVDMKLVVRTTPEEHRRIEAQVARFGRFIGTPVALRLRGASRA